MLFPFKRRSFYLLLSILALKSSILLAVPQHENQLTYQEAASYTHILWNSTKAQPITINLLPIQNFSGIPIEQRNENTDYFSHGKIPIEIDLLSSSLIQATHQFRLDNQTQGDYQFQFAIEQYKLPHNYAPDDSIWQEYKDEVDRWMETEKSTQVKLTLKITSANKPMTTWSKSISTLLTKCDLNSSPQALMPFASDQKNLLNYIKSIPAQAFIAANNYLILEAIQFLNSKPQYATIEKINGGELFIKSLDNQFHEGENLSVYQENKGVISSFPIGLVEVVKTFETQATAFPLNFKPSQIREGDKVAMDRVSQFIKPSYKLNSQNSCGMVKVIDAVAR